ncbi:MAG: hypothetical protein ABIP77_06025, partial [Candidatus Limnocylindrales bacterium]
CGAAIDSMERLPACPACGSVDVDASGGDELILESITYAEPVSVPVTTQADGLTADVGGGR